jgi:uncharacterized protein
MRELIKVQIAYANPEKQLVLKIEINSPCTIKQAILHSNMLAHFPEIDLPTQAVGIWGRRATLDTHCADGDRIEIYRPLVIDPKQARKKRVCNYSAHFSFGHLLAILNEKCSEKCSFTCVNSAFSSHFSFNLA